MPTYTGWMATRQCWQLLMPKPLPGVSSSPGLRLSPFSFALPYPDNTFHRVTASLMLHHLNRAQKRRTLAEVQRVLRPGGELHIADFGPPHTLLTQAMSRVTRLLEETADNLDGLLPAFLTESGFSAVAETGHLPSIVGPLSLYRAVK